MTKNWMASTIRVSPGPLGQMHSPRAARALMVLFAWLVGCDGREPFVPHGLEKLIGQWAYQAQIWDLPGTDTCTFTGVTLTLSATGTKRELLGKATGGRMQCVSGPVDATLPNADFGVAGGGLYYDFFFYLSYPPFYCSHEADYPVNGNVEGYVSSAYSWFGHFEMTRIGTP